MISQHKIWCPSLDSDMKSWCGQATKALKLFPTVLEGGKKQLSDFSDESKLYIMAHGVDMMPLFSSNGKRWNAEELADLLEKDGLPKTQRVIELLVCNAGESVSTVEAYAVIKPARERYDKFMAKNGTKKGDAAEKAIADAKEKYNSLYKKHVHNPTFKVDPSMYLLPLAAQLTQALRKRKYTHFLIISYRSEVATYFGNHDSSNDVYTNPGVYLKVLDLDEHRNPKRHEPTPEQLKRKQPGDIKKNKDGSTPLTKDVLATTEPHLKAVWQ